jgi:predicted Rossmann fold nucleotide-binding protein DprA/Smf involved in DNA uptake
MQIQKELAKISKDLVKMSKRVEKLSASMPKRKGRAQKATMPRSSAPTKVKKSGTQRVLTLINRSRDGVDARTLIKKTGFQDKKIRNIIFKAQKEGKIERVERGVYRISK